MIRTMSNGLALDKFCSCLELWKGCILAGIYSMSTSVFDLLWSIAHMIQEDTVIFFYLLFCLGIESVLFIAATGLLFIALIKRSKCLLIPWLVMAFVDVFFSLLIAFAELAIPNQYNVNGCTVPAVSMMVTLLVCLLTIYCWLCVYGQFIHYAKYYSNASSDIKVSPIDDHDHHHNNDMARTAHPLHQSPNNNNEDMQNRDQQASSEMLFINNQPPNNNIHTLKVPQVSTPRDAW